MTETWLAPQPHYLMSSPSLLLKTSMVSYLEIAGQKEAIVHLVQQESTLQGRDRPTSGTLLKPLDQKHP